MGQNKLAQKHASLEEEDTSSASSSSEEDEQESHNQQELAKQAPESESSEDEEQDDEKDDEDLQSSDSDPGSGSSFIIQPICPQPKKPRYGKRLLPLFEKNAKKEVFEEAGNEKKRSGVGAIKRLWSDSDEVVILRRLMDFESSDTGGIFDLIKSSLSVVVSKKQFEDKIRKLRKKYSYNADRWEKEDLSTPHERQCFEFSKKIWGAKNSGGDGNEKNVNKRARKEKEGEKILGEENNNGVDGNGQIRRSKRERKTIVELNDVVAFPKEESGKEEAALGEGMMDMGVDQVEDIWAMLPCLKKSFSDLAMEPLKSFMMENITRIGAVKVKELEKKWKDLQMEEVGLYLKRVQLMEQQTRLVLDAMKASKD